jgi:hypothetical protein
MRVHTARQPLPPRTPKRATSDCGFKPPQPLRRGEVRDHPTSCRIRLRHPRCHSRACSRSSDPTVNTRLGEPDVNEPGEVAWIDLHELPGMIADGRVVGAASGIGLMAARERLGVS